MAQKYYYGDDIRKLMDAAEMEGYGCVPFADTVCGLGSFVLTAPDDQHYNIIVGEHYATEWSCKYTVTRRRNLPKWVTEAIDKFNYEEEEM